MAVYHVFLVRYLLELSKILYALTGSGKSKMVFFKSLVPISACDEIGMVISIYLRSSYPLGLSRMVYYLTGGGKFKMSPSNRKYPCLSLWTRLEHFNGYILDCTAGSQRLGRLGFYVQGDISLIFLVCAPPSLPLFG